MALKITSILPFTRTFLLISVYFLCSFIAKGQDLKVKLGESTISTSDKFFISLTVPKKLAKEFNSFSYSSFPEIEGLLKYKTEQIKNKEDHTYEIFQYYIPQKAGLVKLAPFILKVGTAQIYSPGKSILIKKGKSQEKDLYPDDLEFSEEDNNFQFQITSDKTEVYVGEGFTVSASFLVNHQNKVKFQLKDLLAQATQMARAITKENCLMDHKSKGIIQNPEFDSIEIKNNAYKILTLFKARFYPLSNEKIIIPPVRFDLIKYQIAKEGHTIWWKAKEISLSSQQLVIKVKELPPHPLRDVVPVGQFHLKESINLLKTTTGKTINYNAILTGNGNLQNVLAPILKQENHFEFFPPKIQLKTLNSDTEQKSFNYKLLAKEAGEYHFSDYFQWIYFNPKLDKYDTLRSNIRVNVTGEKISESGSHLPFNESFYGLANHQKNNLRSKERDENIKYFANIVILFMLVSTAILVLKK